MSHKEHSDLKALSHAPPLVPRPPPTLLDEQRNPYSHVDKILKRRRRRGQGRPVTENHLTNSGGR